MSVHDLGDGRFQVRWRDDNARNCSRTFHDRGDADLLNAQITHARRKGHSLPSVRSMRKAKPQVPQAPVPSEAPTLNCYLLDPYGPVASFYERKQAGLSASTRKMEAKFWDNHVARTLGVMPIDEITPIQIEDWRDALLNQGVGPSSVERTQRFVGKVLADAARRGVIKFNPAQAVDRPRVKSKPVRPLEPSEVERIASHLHGKDKLAVRILGFAGLRPSELFATGNSTGVRWQDLHTDDNGRMTLTVAAGKTGTARVVRILKPLQDDINAFKATVTPQPDDLIIPGPGGGPWTDSDYRNWRKRKWAKACEAAGVGKHRVYDLRHGFASLLIHDLKPITYVAAQLGNGPQIAASTYIHVLDGLDPDLRVTPEEAVNAAKKAVQNNNETRRP